MARGEDPLEVAARGGDIEPTQWPVILERVLPRLDYIVHNEFPIPSLPLPSPLPPSIRRSLSTTPSPSQQSQKENAPPNDLSTPHTMTPRATTPRHTSSPPSHIPDSQPSISLSASSLPPILHTLHLSLAHTLATTFATSPPYTLQRLAELILHPTSHYRTLPSYLRALDRVLSVSSSCSDFPLPPITLENPDPTYLAAGAPAPNDFNGAALTRIPWLRESNSLLLASERPLQGDLRTESTSVIDGPNGAGSLETVTVSVNGLAATASAGDGHEPSGRMTRSSTALARKEEEEEERVHVRGPEEIGMEDMGPQTRGRGFDVEAAVGRPGEGEGIVGDGVGGRRQKDVEGEMNVGKGEGEEGVGDNDANGQQTLVDTSAL